MDSYLRRSSPNSIKPAINNYIFGYNNNPYGNMASGYFDYSGSSGFNTTEYSPYEQTTVELSSNYDNNISNNVFYGNQGFSSKPQNYFSQPQGYSSKPQGYYTQPQEVVKKLKTKKIDEILNQHEYKIETVKSNNIFDKEKYEEEKKLKEREETAFKSKEKKSILEEENKRKKEKEVKQRNNSQINNYIQQIVDLKKQLNDEKEKNKKLLVENNNLKEKIKELDNEINKIQGLEKQIKLLQNKLEQKNIEIQNILKANKKPYEITSIEPGEKIIVVNFVSMATQEISNFGLECKNTDLFVSLEERLYEEFPQFKASDAYYLVNTKRIKRFLTLEQNGIKRNDIISIYFIEE